MSGISEELQIAQYILPSLELPVTCQLQDKEEREREGEEEEVKEKEERHRLNDEGDQLIHRRHGLRNTFTIRWTDLYL